MNLLSSLLKFTADTLGTLKTSLTNYGTRLGTAETKVTNMESQLATAISAVTVDSEVQNIRVGDDNVTYASAGIAVRTQFANVKSALNDITEVATKNLFDSRQLNKVSGITVTDGVYSATAGNFASAFPSTSQGLVIEGGFKENQRYTLSMKIKNTGPDTTSGWGIKFEILYTNATTRNTQVNKNVTTFEERTLTSEANKTIDKIYITAPSSASNVWELKDIQIEEGASATSYEAFDMSAVDDIARGDTSELNTRLDNDLYFNMDMPLAKSGFIKYSDGTIQSSSGACYFILKNVGYKEVSYYGNSGSTSVAWVAFYNTDSISADGYMQSDSKAYDYTSGSKWFTASVPATAKIIVVCGSVASVSYTPAVKFLVSDLYEMIKAEEQKQINRVAYFMPYKDMKVIDHCFVDQVTSDLTQNIIIPCQSVFHVALSARLGYKYIECNVQKTATDGKYIVTHGVSGKLGKDFETTGGESAYGTVIGDTSYADLRSDYHYISQYPAYRVPPTSLEEFLYACKENKIVPMVQYRDDTMLEIAKGIMGNEMILYNGDHTVFDGLIHTFHTYTTKTEIVNQCLSIGAPYFYGLGNPDAFTDEELTDIIDTVHKMGCLVGISSAYSPVQRQRCMELGVDFDGVGSYVNQFETGDIVTLNDFTDFNLSGGATVSDGALSMPTDANANSGEHSGGLIKWCCKAMFDGTLKIDNKTFTSDGTHVVYVSGFKINEPHTLWVVAQANTTVTMLKYVASKC